MKINKQRILYFTRSPIHAGTENVILQLCELFKDECEKIVVCGGSGFRKQELKKMGITFYEIPDIEKKDLFTFINVSKILRNIVKSEKITLIHTHHRMAAFYITVLGLHRKCVFFNTSHNTFHDKKFLTRLSYKHANLIACGNKVKENLESYYNMSNVTTIPNAVMPYKKEIVPDEQIQSLKRKGKYVISNIGRLTEQKGMEFFLRAVPQVIKEHPNSVFIIVGDGEREKELRLLAESLNIKDYVFFFGYRTDIQNIMLQSDVVALTSLWEGFPLTPLEAFSVGKTVIATSVDGTIEIVENSKNGLLIEPRDEKAIADKIIWLIEHPTKKIEMEKQAKKDFKNKYSIQILKKSYLNCYERVKYGK